MARTRRLRSRYVLAVVVLLLPAILQAQTYVLERAEFTEKNLKPEASRRGAKTQRRAQFGPAAREKLKS